MSILESLHHPERYFKIFLKWGLLGVFMGGIGGLLGAGFHHVLHFVTEVRQEHGWLVLLLPLTGLLTVGSFKVLLKGRNRGTN